ncbi:MarR family winged helix-turn-helix transcriptional regulator [Chromobacterium paludis]|uniref:MarR family transcriptional regulator n=1 Tax=Chromobacterium paludis TaxID=2605945 RepID=A0A5C1DIU1_9NEIS|nr:MarR family transcriptional regulator [Chromobacterium paludis]QEL55638.1 MarR family transcriptional regulator [Chromobacterium paludis]
MNYANLPGPGSYKLVAERIRQVNQRLPCETPHNVDLFHQVDHLWKWLMACMSQTLFLNQLKPVSFFTLLMLYSETDGCMTPTFLAECLGEGRSNTTRICDELVSKGWICRKKGEEFDRRRVELILTPQGTAMVETQLLRLRELADIAFDPLDDGERNALGHLLTKLAAFAE